MLFDAYINMDHFQLLVDPFAWYSMITFESVYPFNGNGICFYFKLSIKIAYKDIFYFLAVLPPTRRGTSTRQLRYHYYN